ncbi:hypothetical protein KA111_02330 [Candidatus Woesebacteria bacterium]|nr:hypothetical protein [Candidatus Woesebacteria bacterium]
MTKKLKSLAVTAAALAASSSRVLAATAIEVPDAFFTDVGALISKALNFVLIIGALLVFMYLIWGGIEWITSGGDKGKTESARNKITAAIVGLIVLASAWAVLLLVLGFLNTDLDTLFTEAGV